MGRWKHASGFPYRGGLFSDSNHHSASRWLRLALSVGKFLIRCLYPRLTDRHCEGGFWTSYAILIQPSFRVAAGFAPANATDSSFAGVTATAAGAATRAYNSGVGLYFVTWAVLCFIYTVAALRT
jgi:hypothetical protein